MLTVIGAEPTTFVRPPFTPAPMIRPTASLAVIVITGDPVTEVGWNLKAAIPAQLAANWPGPVIVGEGPDPPSGI